MMKRKLFILCISLFFLNPIQIEASNPDLPLRMTWWKVRSSVKKLFTGNPTITVRWRVLQENAREHRKVQLNPYNLSGR